GGVHWNGDTWMDNPYDFEIKSRTDEKYGADKLSDDYLIQDWGITYDELLPYYEKFEATAGISGEQNPMGPERRKDYPTQIGRASCRERVEHTTIGGRRK